MQHLAFYACPAFKFSLENFANLTCPSFTPIKSRMLGGVPWVQIWLLLMFCITTCLNCMLVLTSQVIAIALCNESLMELSQLKLPLLNIFGFFVSVRACVLFLLMVDGLVLTITIKHWFVPFRSSTFYDTKCIYPIPKEPIRNVEVFVAIFFLSPTFYYFVFLTCQNGIYMRHFFS